MSILTLQKQGFSFVEIKALKLGQFQFLIFLFFFSSPYSDGCVSIQQDTRALYFLINS